MAVAQCLENPISFCYLICSLYITPFTINFIQAVFTVYISLIFIAYYENPFYWQLRGILSFFTNITYVTC